MTRNRSLLFLVISQIVYTLFIFVWLLITGLSAMMFDSPGSENSVLLWTVFCAILAYPAGFLAGIIMSWLSFVRERYKAAAIWNCLPLLWVFPVIGFLMYASFS